MRPFLEPKIGGEEMKNNKILKLAGIVVLAVAMVFAFITFSEKPVEGSKAITIEVVDDKQKSTVYELKTDALYLKGAMDEAKGLTYDGADSTYGFSVHTINGVKADYNTDNAYWSFYVNDEYCNYGVDTQPVNDKDAFKIVYTGL